MQVPHFPSFSQHMTKGNSSQEPGASTHLTERYIAGAFPLCQSRQTWAPPRGSEGSDRRKISLDWDLVISPSSKPHKWFKKRRQISCQQELGYVGSTSLNESKSGKWGKVNWTRHGDLKGRLRRSKWPGDLGVRLSREQSIDTVSRQLQVMIYLFEGTWYELMLSKDCPSGLRLSLDLLLTWMGEGT
jgi:hypothetical protein